MASREVHSAQPISRFDIRVGERDGGLSAGRLRAGGPLHDN